MDSTHYKNPVDMTRPSPDKDLMTAALVGNATQLLAALDAGGDLEARLNDLCTPVLAAALSNPDYEVSKLLADRGANLLAVNEDQETVLHGFARAGWSDLVEKALDAGCDVNAPDDAGVTPLCRAKEHFDVVKTLIRRGAAPFSKTASGQRYMEIDTVARLNAAVEGGLPVDTTSEDGATLLMLSFPGDNPDLTEAFIAHGADINAADNDGVRPIAYAVMRGAVRSFVALLESGAETDFMMRDGTHFEEVLLNSSEEMRNIYRTFFARQAARQVAGRRRTSPVQ